MPDPSVLRAAVMGSIGAMAILGGRPKRTGALLSLAILVLLMADPWLARDFAFILSVLAALGLHLVGQRCVVWLHALLPVWLAQAVAIPLAAQLFCSPVIVLMQARLTVYTIPANMLAAPLIALVTMVGTLGLVVAVLIPPAAALCAAVSGVGAWWVALVARFMSGLPAASLPWPEGVQGMVLMALLNVLVLLLLLAIVEREQSRLLARKLVRYLPDRWRRRYGFLTVAVMAAGLTVWWTAAVVQL
ncbi:ComEC/Rec2 family competence protein [Arthrobacter psychrolactophilus]